MVKDMVTPVTPNWRMALYNFPTALPREGKMVRLRPMWVAKSNLKVVVELQVSLPPLFAASAENPNWARSA